VLPVVQGTSENAAHQIIDNGFGIASALDDGWYGRGIYFTSYLKYASLYAKFSSSNGCKVFLVSLVIPGNVYPATEPARDDPLSLMGGAAKKGHQSHYVEVNLQGQPARSEREFYADEIVVFEGCQTLPLFLVYSSEFWKTAPTEDQIFLTADVVIEGENASGEVNGNEDSEEEDDDRDREDLLSLLKSQRKEMKDMRQEIEDQARKLEDMEALVARLRMSSAGLN